MTKVCSGCGRDLPLTAFAKNKNGKFGVHSKCKECKNSKQKASYNPEKQSQYYQENKEQIAEYRQTNEWKQLHAEQSRRYRKKYPEKVRAHAAVAQLNLETETCVMCGAMGIEKHHPDYSQPLDIIWLCKKCHTEIHNK